MLKTINTCVTGLQSRRRQPYRGNQPASGRAACPWLCFVDWVAHCGMSHGPVQANSHHWRCVSGWVPHATSAATEPAPDVSHGDPTSRRESARCPPPAIPAILSTHVATATLHRANPRSEDAVSGSHLCGRKCSGWCSCPFRIRCLQPARCHLF
jgi:hypothetical protein